MHLGSGPSGFVVATGKYGDPQIPSLNAGWFSKNAVDDGDAEKPADSGWVGWGFQFRTSSNGNFVHVVIPYSSIVIPLTVVSASLLLVPLRKRPCTASQHHA
jgi:hypothetical protein